MATATRLTTACVLLGTILGLAPDLVAQLAELRKLVPDDAAAGDLFGAAVATDGTRVLVGAPHADGAGAAFLFDATTGAQLFAFEALGSTPGETFGEAVALDDDYVVIGASLADVAGPDSGTVYVFDALSGAQLHALTPVGAAGGDRFGLAVAAADGLAVIGSASSAYLFDLASGQQLHEFARVGASTTFGLSGFGEAVDIADGLVAVGARLENGVSGLAGAVYVFDAASGEQLHRLVALNGTAWAFFGACVALDDGVLAIGAPEAAPKGKHSGAAYLFNAHTGAQEHYLVPGDGHIFAKFGSSAAVDGDAVFFGSPQNNPAGLFSAGAVYSYAADGELVAKLVASDAAVSREFGSAVAAAGGRLVAGCAQDDVNGEASGSAYLFGVETGSWVDVGGGKAGSAGHPDLVGDGALVAHGQVSLEVAHGRSFAAAHLVIGFQLLSAPFKGGTLIPSPDLILPPLQLDGAGAWSAQFVWPTGIPSGSHSYYQVWIQDPAATAQLSATNGLLATTP